jgi:hypothetical protein
MKPGRSTQIDIEEAAWGRTEENKDPEFFLAANINAQIFEGTTPHTLTYFNDSIKAILLGTIGIRIGP